MKLLKRNPMLGKYYQRNCLAQSRNSAIGFKEYYLRAELYYNVNYKKEDPNDPIASSVHNNFISKQYAKIGISQSLTQKLDLFTKDTEDIIINNIKK